VKVKELGVGGTAAEEEHQTVDRAVVRRLQRRESAHSDLCLWGESTVVLIQRHLCRCVIRAQVLQLVEMMLVSCLEVRLAMNVCFLYSMREKCLNMMQTSVREVSVSTARGPEEGDHVQVG
jgi:hypothetical protein